MASTRPHTDTDAGQTSISEAYSPVAQQPPAVQSIQRDNPTPNQKSCTTSCLCCGGLCDDSDDESDDKREIYPRRISDINNKELRNFVQDEGPGVLAQVAAINAITRPQRR